MERYEELLKRYGLVPRIEFVHNIRKLLIEEIDKKSPEGNEYLKTLCIQLFALGYVEDSLLIWKAKEKIGIHIFILIFNCYVVRDMRKH
ncbi:hypothetical protein ACFVSW_27805 [Neobacillus sp. NPDC058068]|uniref:hypothetical protein n=1 Tax=Neobacillus sp. NPDC058068 TaxID=3346325 RepID=UPI0036D8838F